MNCFKLKKTAIMEIIGQDIIEQANIPRIPIIRVRSIRYFRLDYETIRVEIIYSQGQTVQYFWNWVTKSWQFLKDINYEQILQAKKESQTTNDGPRAFGSV